MGADGAVVRRGRRPGAVRMRRFTIALSLHPVVDAALIAALEGAGNRAALVREWLRSGVRSGPDPGGMDDRPDLDSPGIEL